MKEEEKSFQLETEWAEQQKRDALCSIEYGGVAQLGEHLLCKQGVIGSIPFISTRTEMSKRIRVQGAGQPPLIQDMG